jgi:hypothetical protein
MEKSLIEQLLGGHRMMMDGWVDGRTGGRIGGWMDGWVSGWINLMEIASRMRLINWLRIVQITGFV